MSTWLYALRDKRDGVTIPTIWVAVALSVLLHIALMWKWLPQIHLPSLEDKRDEPGGSLVVRLAPPPRPPTPPSASSAPSGAPTLQAQPSPRRESRPAAPPPPPPAAPVIALNQPAAPAAPTSPAPPPVTAPAPARPPADGDLASYIESRRRARNDSGAPAPAQTGLPAAMASAPQQLDDDKDRSNRVVAMNLAQRKQAFGYDPSKSGGVFDLKRVGATDAEFVFFGWDKTIRRNTMQLIEVQKGNNADTRIAVVRKMISIIREYEQEDFLWESHRLGRNLMLSARARDNAGLEEFMMREFFEDPSRPQ